VLGVKRRELTVEENWEVPVGTRRAKAEKELGKKRMRKSEGEERKK